MSPDRARSLRPSIGEDDVAGADVLAQVLNAMERHGADRAVFQGNRIAGVSIGGNAIEPKRFARQLESGDVILRRWGAIPRF
ncbi:hypothetical protein ACU4HD_47595 [Cupriavidus basilensis]